MSPTLAELAWAVSDSDGTPLIEVSVPLNTTGEVVMPGMVSADDDSVIDQLSRFASVPTNPMVDVTPDSVHARRCRAA